MNQVQDIFRKENSNRVGMKMSEAMGGSLCSGLDAFEIAATTLNSGVKKTMNL